MNWNYDTGILKSNGIEIKLPEKQADVFEYLVTKKDNKATSSEIFKAIYGNAALTYPQPRVIRVHFRRLKKRLEGTLINLHVIRHGQSDGVFCLNY